jgi:anthranilate phosphoribosyltransferase
VLEALGVSIEAPVGVMEAALRQAGIVFMFAPLMHPAMRHVGPIRREIGVQTVMNLVGPLANPARAGRQVVGVSEAKRLALIAGALQSLDTVHALVVHGTGMDEISPFAETQVLETRGGVMKEWTIDPVRYGFGGGAAADIAGGAPDANAATVLGVLRGEGNAPATAAVVLNAAAAFYVAGRTKDFDEGVEVARGAITSGVGLVALERLREAFRKPPT